MWDTIVPQSTLSLPSYPLDWWLSKLAGISVVAVVGQDVVLLAVPHESEDEIKMFAINFE